MTVSYLEVMRFGLLLMLMVLLGEAQGQFIAPYNPDSNQDSAIGSADLIDFLAFFGYDFLPPAIEIEGEDVLSTLIALTEQVAALQEQVVDLQNNQLTQDSVISMTWLRNLRSTQLSGVSMVDFDVSRVDFSYANLQDAQLMNSSLDNTVFNSANLQGANLTNADMDAAILVNADLTGANMTNAYLAFSTLQGADLSGTDLSTCILTSAIMTCLQGCPEALPSDYTCQPDSSCAEPGRFRIDEID